MKNVLVVDDSAFMRLTIKKILLNAGYNVIGEANNGKAGIEKFKKLDPDLVIMDVTMAEMDGLEALKKIKEYDKDARIIICSAMGQKPMVLEAIKNGASDYIVKPFNEDRVLIALKKAIGE